MAKHFEWTKLATYAAEGKGITDAGEEFSCKVDGSGEFYMWIGPEGPDQETQFIKLAPETLAMEQVEALKHVDLMLERHKAKMEAKKQ